MSYKPVANQRPNRYKVSTAEYAQYQRQGFLVVERLVDLDEVEELKAHVMAMLKGQIDVPGQEPPSPEATDEELVQRFTRVHQLHRWDATCERFLLHPRVLDVLEALIGPDVLALQTMQFFNAPGMGGQGWHQDSYTSRPTRTPSSALGWPWSGPTKRTAVCGSRRGRTTSLFIQTKAGDIWSTPRSL